MRLPSRHRQEVAKQDNRKVTSCTWYLAKRLSLIRAYEPPLLKDNRRFEVPAIAQSWHSCFVFRKWVLMFIEVAHKSFLSNLIWIFISLNYLWLLLINHFFNYFIYIYNCLGIWKHPSSLATWFFFLNLIKL